MTTSLRLATVAIGTVLLTTSALADDPKPFSGIVLVAPAGYTATPTLVQQLQANLAYQLHHYALDGYVKNYHYYASQRLAKQLTAALAAAAVGNPGNPILKEDGTVAPINSYVATPGSVVGTAPPSGNVVARAANALVAALSGDDGTTPLNPDSGIPSGNPDSGAPSSNPDGGSTPSSSISSARSAMATASAAGGDSSTLSSNPDTGIASSNPDTGIKSSNPDGGGGAAGGG